MNPILKYIQETRAELRHVAWPTQSQTIIYTVMVVLLSVGVAFYLGLFDFIFTTSLTRALNKFPHYAPIQTEQPLNQLPQGAVVPIENQPNEQKAPAAPAADTKAPAPKKAPANSFSIPTN